MQNNNRENNQNNRNQNERNNQNEHNNQQNQNERNQKENRKGNVFTVIGRALDDIGEDMSQSPSNFLRDAVSTAAVVGLAPVSVVLMLI